MPVGTLDHQESTRQTRSRERITETSGTVEQYRTGNVTVKN